MKRFYLKLVLVVAACAAFATQAGDFSRTKSNIETAMASDIRTDKEKARDANRKPIETLEFFGLRDDMTIVELVPGGGWYSKILAPTVKEHGKYYAALGTSRLKERLLDKPGFEKAKVVAEDSKLWREEGARFYSLEVSGLGVKNADMVLTFRNYHNFDRDARMAMNKAVFDSLKSGGIYAVVDHTTRHMEPLTPENRRRVDPVKAIKEILDSGFEFVGYTDLHYRPNDDLTLEVGHDSVTGKTDRWTFKFRKP